MSGTTRKYSISMPEDLAESVREKVGPGGFSAFVTEAVRQQVAMDRLTEIVDDHETRAGTFTEAELAEADRLLGGDHRSHVEHPPSEQRDQYHEKKSAA